MQREYDIKMLKCKKGKYDIAEYDCCFLNNKS